MDKTDLASRMKDYEHQTNPLISIDSPIVIRLDGNSFSKFTKKHNFEKPFDERMNAAMIAATKGVLNYISNYVCGYTQSDEITIIINPMDTNVEKFFLGGRINKICSLLASHCSGAFNSALHQQGMRVFSDFDCRIFNVPTEEAINALLWRQYDCWKNYVGVVAHYKLNESLHKVDTAEKIEKLKKAGIDIYSDYDLKYHYGSTFYKKEMELPMPEEFKKFPSNKGKDFIVRSELVEDNSLFNSQEKRDLFSRLMIDGVIRK